MKVPWLARLFAPILKPVLRPYMFPIVGVFAAHMMWSFFIKRDSEACALKPQQLISNTIV